MKRIICIFSLAFLGWGLIFSQPSQALKNLIDTTKLIAEKEEEPLVKTIALFQAKAPEFNVVEQAIVHSMIAECLWSYLQQNQYAILKRTALANPDLTDIRTWDIRLLLQQCIAYYELSLQPQKELQQTLVQTYETLLDTGDRESKIQRPTLFDLLAFRAIETFSDELLQLTKPHAGFAVDNPQYFSKAAVFQTLKIPSKDTLSLDYRVLKIYQQLCAFHAPENRLEVLIPLDLQRLEWVREKATFAYADSLYPLALENYLTLEPNNAATAQVYWALAEFHYEIGEQYADNIFGAYFEAYYRWRKITALNYVNTIIERYPNTKFAEEAKKFAKNIQQAATSLTMADVVLPDQHNLFLLEYANLDKVYFALYRLSDEDFKKIEQARYDHEFLEKLNLKQTFYKQWEEEIPNPNDYQSHRVELSIEPLPVGYYVLLASSKKDFSEENVLLKGHLFGVSELTYISTTDNQKLEGVVLHRKTGKPLSDVKIRLYKKEYNYQARQNKITEIATLTSSKDGKFEYASKQDGYSSLAVELHKKSDVLLSGENVYFWNRENPNENWGKRMFLFSDRAIYRPGQTVYFKGILIEERNHQGNVEKRLATDVATSVKLFNTNYKEIASIDVKTNEYGSFSGQFVLPSNGLNGQYYLSGEVGSLFFSVEEYKRPSFEITFEPLKDAYPLDQKINVSGFAKTYSGAGLGQSTVKYSVMRSSVLSWFRGCYGVPETVITQGETTCDETGKFEISFVTHRDPRLSSIENPKYVFTITVEITDISGETQTNLQQIFISPKTFIRLAVPEKIDKTKAHTLPILSTNLSGEKTPSRGTIKIFRLVDGRLLQDRKWESPDTFLLSEKEFVKRFPNAPYYQEDSREKREKTMVLEKSYDTEKDSVLVLENISEWISGEYFYLIETQDKSENTVKDENCFTVYSPKSGKDILKKLYYDIVPTAAVEPGQTFSFIVGSAAKTTVFYEIQNQNKVIERQTITLNKEQKTIDFPIREAHRGNLHLSILCVENNRVYTKTSTISVPFTNKKIDIALKTLREKLTPNERENWTLQLLSNDKKPLKGELLLGMYDASLDVFDSESWDFDWNNYLSSFRNWHARQPVFYTSIDLRDVDYYSFSTPEIRYDRLNFTPPYNLMGYGNGRKLRAGGVAETLAGRVAGIQTETANEQANEKIVLRGYESDKIFMVMESESSSASATSPIAKTPVMSVVPRSNLKETAFFYPHLQSDENGNISVSFTVPESLTRWKIRGLAHTQDLKLGTQEWSAMTQKSLMIYPNMPRFLREGDQLNFQAKIMNLSENSISGEAQLLVDETALPSNSFTLSPQGNTSVNWLYQATGAGLLNLKFLASAENHTDGEAHILPVLSNRTMVTETKPLFALPDSEQKFSFEKLAKPQSKTLENYRLTLEVATNPIWFAVQALPQLSSPNSENSVALFGAYFANSMAMDILKQNPEIKTVFNRWKAANSETLQSNLENNQDLKSVLLEETPWLLEAESETRQKQSIALYFDENNVQNLQANLLARLQKLQLPNGAFAWYPGGREDWWGTQYIVHGLQKLHRRNIGKDQPELQIILQKALNYCDARHIDRYQQLQNSTPKIQNSKFKIQNLSPNDIQYLYLRTYFAKEYPVSPELTDVLENYDSISKVSWKNQSKYLQGVLALYFDLKSEQKFVQDIMQNFQRLALKSAETGMYWRYEPSWFWHESAIETQSQLIETFSILGKTQDLTLMKQWLLSQKRTTQWNTPKASVDAIYALLNGTPNLAENTQVNIQVGDEKIAIPNADAGSGYFKTSWTAEKMNSKQAGVTIKNSGNAMVWGGLYWQYFENLDQIKTAATPLSIKKQLFVERMDNRGATLEPIPESGLKIGDKVTVRIEIRVDRDMEYVHLKDLRAAAFEPMNAVSGYRYQDRLSYYQETKDVSTNFYFDRLPKGTYVFEYNLKASQIGEFSNGYTTMQCLYAPEFSAHSQGERVKVGE